MQHGPCTDFFSLAAKRLLERYYRRYPHDFRKLAWRKFDQTTVKDRWYAGGGGRCNVVCNRIGGRNAYERAKKQAAMQMLPKPRSFFVTR